MIYKKIYDNKHIFKNLLIYASTICGGFTDKQRDVINNFSKLYLDEENFEFFSQNQQNAEQTKDDILVQLNTVNDEQIVFVMMFELFLIFSCDGLSEYKKTRLLDIVSALNISIESIYLLFDIFVNHKIKNHSNILSIGGTQENDIILQKYHSSGALLQLGTQYFVYFEDLSVGNVNNLVKVNQNLASDWVIYPINDDAVIDFYDKTLTMTTIKNRFFLKNNHEVITYSVVKTFDENLAASYKVLPTTEVDNIVGKIMVISGIVSIENSVNQDIITIYGATDLTLKSCSIDDVLFIDKTYKLNLADNIENIVNFDEMSVQKVKYEIMTIGTDKKSNIVLDGLSYSVSLTLQKQEGAFGENLWELTADTNNNLILFNGRTLERNKIAIKTGDVLSVDNHHISFDPDNDLVSYTKNVITSLEFKKLTYYHRNNKSEPALRNLSFFNQSGDFCCVMGPSGAGKSTFVKVLANIYKTKTDDMVFCNGQSLNKNFDVFKKYFSYVAQEDVLFDNLTVYENLYHYGKLKNPKISSATLNKKIDEILIKTNLINKKDQIISTPDGMILSGGERRRLNIALELIADTDIMILDEPTSGLSSYDSENIINLLQDLCRVGKIIYVVIHQPSREIYLKFTHLLLLDEGGTLAYFGSTRESFYYFSKYASDGTYPKNPDDIFSILEEVKKTPDGKVIYESTSKQSHPVRMRTPAQWEYIFGEYRKTKQKQTHSNTSTQLPPRIKLTAKDQWTQFQHLLRRNLSNKFHGQRFLIMSILMPLCLALVALFLRGFSPSYTFYSNGQVPKFLFLSAIILIFLAVSNSINEILNERYIIRKERMIGYSITSYYTSKLISQTLLSLYQVGIYIIVSFLILKIPIVSKLKFFFKFYLLSVVASISVSAVALLLSSIIKTEKQAFMVIPIFIIPQIVLGGMFINYNDINFKLSAARPVPEICDIMHARWMFEGYTALMQTNDVVNKGVNDFSVDYNILTKKGSSKDKYATTSSVVFARRLELLENPRTRKDYYKANKIYARCNVNIFPSTVKLFYSRVLSTYWYNILVMSIIALLCAVFTIIRVRKEK